MLEQNQILGGHYRFIQALGEGGLAKTYLVEDLHRPGQPTCVIKCLKPVSHDARFMTVARRLFNREAVILEELGQHDQIPRLLAYFEDPKTQEFFLVQEYIEGQTLDHELPPDHQWSEEKTLAFLQDGLSVLSFVHSFNVIHRDIKPTNLIRRERDGSLVLIDFGAVKPTTMPSDLTAEDKSRYFSTVSIGTQGYAPTEQIRGRPRLNSDIYALGMVAIQALTGIAPINLQEDDEGELIWRNFAEVSEELAAILARMVRYHFKDRYQRTADVLQDLEQLSSGIVAGTESDFSQVQTTPQATPTRNLSTTVQTTVQQENTGKTPPTETLTPPTGPTEIISTKPTHITGETVETITGPPSQESLKSVEASARPTQRKSPKVKLAVAGLVTILGGAALGGVYFSKNLALANLQQQLDTLYGQQKYTECADLGQTAITKKQVTTAKIQEPLDRCSLGMAQQKAKEQKLAEAMTIAMAIPSNSSQYQDAQKLINQWSKDILAQATQLYEQQGQLTEAIATLQHIPESNALHQDADKREQEWQANHKANTTLLQAAEAALKTGQSEVAIAKADQIKSPQYWTQKAEQIKKEAQTQIAARPRPRPVQRAAKAKARIRTSPVRKQPSRTTRRRVTVKKAVPRRKITVRSAPRPKPAVRVKKRRAPIAKPVPRKKPVVKLCPGPLCPQ